ncbi:MAG: nuclear transport factor 2 family protein [Vicinamibacteria bacterium]
MSQQNLEVVRELVDAFNRNDVEGVLAAFAEDCELDEPPEMPDRPGQGFRGHDGIREWMANLRSVGGIRFEPRGFTSSGDVIVWECRRAERVADYLPSAACSRFDRWGPESQSEASRRASTGSSPRRSASM